MNLLKKIKNETWLSYLMREEDELDKNTIRNLRPHRSHLKIMVNTLKNGSPNLVMGISGGENHRYFLSFESEI